MNESIRDVVARLSASATALAGLAAAMRARTSGATIDPGLMPHIQAMLEHAGAATALEQAKPEELAPLLAELRHFWLLDDDFIRHPDRKPGWTYTDHDVLASGGEITQGFANALVRFAPELEGLSERLAAPGATFLDVGVGVAGLAIGMAKNWPQLRVVGVDPSAAANAQARANIAAAKLEGRIEIRSQSAEDLTDEAAYDLAWIPAPFMRPNTVCKIAARARKAVKPGGWVLLAAAATGDDLRGAAMGFRVSLYGGRPATREECFKLLADAGFEQARALPSPPRDFKMVIAARVPAIGVI